MAHHTTLGYTADDALDLRRDWEAAARGGTQADLRAWLEQERPHLLRAYDAEFLLRAAQASRAGAAP